MNKKTKIILRILISPFLLCIILIKVNYLAFYHVYLVIKYGGEWITYSEEDDIKTIREIYYEIKLKRQSKHDSTRI